MWCFRWEVVARIIAGSEGVVGLRIETGEQACMHVYISTRRSWFSGRGA